MSGLAVCTLVLAIVLHDETPLRLAPRSDVRPHAMLMQGETLEVRGERLEYLQVWDHRRERGGFVRASQVRRLAMKPEEAPEILSVLRFLRNMQGSEALGIGFAAAYIEAATPEALGGDTSVEVLDALGTMAERLARRPSRHLDVAARYGVRFTSVERNGRMRICYDGAAFRSLLAMNPAPEPRARAVLALTDPACGEPDAELVDKLDELGLPPLLRNRVYMRRAALWAAQAFERARKGLDSRTAAEKAITALAAVEKDELGEADRAAYEEVAVRVGASRPALFADQDKSEGLRIETMPGDPGQTCVLLRDARDRPIARRCTYGVVWSASAIARRDGGALAFAVQQTDTWRELWVFRKTKKGWNVRIVPPAVMRPGIGYAEFSGWTAGGLRVVRGAIVDGRLVRTTGAIGL